MTDEILEKEKENFKFSKINQIAQKRNSTYKITHTTARVQKCAKQGQFNKDRRKNEDSLGL